MKLIFLFSLPRSGSTLAQRVLAAHPQVATASESWLLLPLLAPTREDVIVAQYGHPQALSTVNEFLDGMRDGQQAYSTGIRSLAMDLYERAAGDADYFIDKTPRYHLIVDEILEMFPDAKVVFLWRNPLAIAASMVTTWSPRDRWIVHRYKIDLFRGLENLVAAAQRNADRSFTLKYEDMITDPNATFRDVFGYLGLSFDPDVLEEFANVALHGRMGDPTGTKKYAQISQASLSQWPSTYHNWIRMQWARAYLDWIGSERLTFMGYDKGKILASLLSAHTSPLSLLSDIPTSALGSVNALLDIQGLMSRIKDLRHGRRVFLKR